MSDNLTKIAEDSARGGFFLFSGNIISLFILAIGSVLIARLLGQDNYGLYSLSIVVPLLFINLMDFGINSAMTRFSAKYRSEGKPGLAASILKTGFIFKILIGLAFFCLSFFFSDFFAIYFTNRSETSPFIKFTSLLIIFQTIFNSLGSSFMGLDKMEGTALTSFVQAIVKTGISPLLIFLGFGIFGALTGHVLGYIIASIVGSLIFIRFYRNLGPRSNSNFINDTKVILNYGLPLYAPSLLGLIIPPFQTIILAYNVSNVIIGNYAVSGILLSMLSIVTVPFDVLFATFSKVNANNGEIKSVFRRSIKYTSLIIIPSAVIILTLSKEIVQTLYGQEFILAPFYLQLATLNFLFAGLGSIVLGSLLAGLGDTRIIFKSNLLNFSTFLPLAVILTILYNVPGLIISTVISNLISILYQLNIAIKRTGTVPDFKASIKIYLTSFISVLPVLLLINILKLNNIISLIVNSLLFLFVYLTCLPIVGAINLIDIENIKIMFKKIKIIWPILKPILSYELRLYSYVKSIRYVDYLQAEEQKR